MPVIKSAESSTSLQRTAFNFDDLKHQGERYLDDVKHQGQQLMELARREALTAKQRLEAEIRQSAEQSAQQRVQQAAETLVDQRLQTLRPALEQAVRSIEKARGDWQAHWGTQAIHLAVAIAQRVIRRELARDPAIQAGYIREALELISAEQQVLVRIHPQDHEALKGAAGRWVESLLARTSARLLPDETVTRGGCVVETQHGQIDQRIETQLARIEEELAR